jgi:hypothetical protein
MAHKPASWGEVGRGFFFVGLAVVLLLCYNALDGYGWIPHSGKTNVKFPKHAWEAGEYLTCAAVTLPKTETDLDCSGDPFDSTTIREMDVTLWGHVGEHPLILKCQRTAESISCHLP